MTIPLMKHAFFHDIETRETLADFIVNSDQLSMGPMCRAFERDFAVWQGRANAVLFNSGASANLALLQALKNLGRLKEGARVGFSALTWSTNVMPILQMGFVPVPLDVERSMLNLRVPDAMSPLWDDLDAIFVTNALGLAPHLPLLKYRCELHGVLLLEDNCEALGTELHGSKTGNFGQASTFSFYVAHHMSTIEGGMVSTDDPTLAEMLKMVRANGWDRNLSSSVQDNLRALHGITSEFDAKYTFYDLAFNMRPTEIAGFLGLQQLRHLDENILRRQRTFRWLHAATLMNPDLIPLEISHLSRISAFAFPVLCKTPELRVR